MFVSSKLTEDSHRCYSCKLCRNSPRAHVHYKHQLRATPAGGSMCRDVSASSAGWTRELTQWWGSYGGAVEVGAAAAAAPADTFDGCATVIWLRSCAQHGHRGLHLRDPARQCALGIHSAGGRGRHLPTSSGLSGIVQSVRLRLK